MSELLKYNDRYYSLDFNGNVGEDIDNTDGDVVGTTKYTLLVKDSTGGLHNNGDYFFLKENDKEFDVYANSNIFNLTYLKTFNKDEKEGWYKIDISPTASSLTFQKEYIVLQSQNKTFYLPINTIVDDIVIYKVTLPKVSYYIEWPLSYPTELHILKTQEEEVLSDEVEVVTRKGYEYNRIDTTYLEESNLEAYYNNSKIELIGNMLYGYSGLFNYTSGNSLKVEYFINKYSESENPTKDILDTKTYVTKLNGIEDGTKLGVNINIKNNEIILFPYISMSKYSLTLRTGLVLYYYTYNSPSTPGVKYNPNNVNIDNIKYSWGDGLVGREEVSLEELKHFGLPSERLTYNGNIYRRLADTDLKDYPNFPSNYYVFDSNNEGFLYAIQQSDDIAKSNITVYKIGLEDNYIAIPLEIKVLPQDIILYNVNS